MIFVDLIRDLRSEWNNSPNFAKQNLAKIIEILNFYLLSNAFMRIIMTGKEMDKQYQIDTGYWSYVFKIYQFWILFGDSLVRRTRKLVRN